MSGIKVVRIIHGYGYSGVGGAIKTATLKTLGRLKSRGELRNFLTGEAHFEFGASTTGFVRAEYIFDDKVQIVENVGANIASREVSTWNASLGLQWDNGFEASLWGRNLNNDDYLLSAFPSVAQSGSFSGYPNEPRTYGLTLRMSF